MELHVNRIEIVGRVGQVRVNEYGDSKTVANFSVITEVVMKRHGSIISESTWHNVTAWEGPAVASFDKLQKGSLVKVVGRLRNSKYTGADGIERIYTEFLASSLDILPREG